MGRRLAPNDHRPFEVPLARDPRHAQRPVVSELHGLSLVDLRMQWSVVKRVNGHSSGITLTCVWSFEANASKVIISK